MAVTTKNIHNPRACKGRNCPFHNPSEHKMRDWPILIRFDRYMALCERTCQHGVGQDDPDSLDFIESALPKERRGYEGIHGCDGCCFK